MMLRKSSLLLLSTAALGATAAIAQNQNASGPAKPAAHSTRHEIPYGFSRLLPRDPTSRHILQGNQATLHLRTPNSAG